MIGFNIKVTGMEGVKRTLAQLPRDMRDKAIGPAINKTAQKAKTEIKRGITEEYAVKADEVASAISIKNARSGQPEATISIFGSKTKRGRSANMIHFIALMQAAGVAFKTRGAKVTKKQAREFGKQLGFIIKRGGSIKKIEGAFLGNRGRTVFMREGKERLPIKPVQVIGFSQMFNSKKISRRVMAKVESDFKIELDRAIAMVLSKK